MSSATAAVAAEPVGNNDNLSTLDILQEINLLREDEFFIDIHIEVCDPFVGCLIFLPFVW